MSIMICLTIHESILSKPFDELCVDIFIGAITYYLFLGKQKKTYLINVVGSKLTRLSVLYEIFKYTF